MDTMIYYEENLKQKYEDIAIVHDQICYGSS